MLRTNKIFSFEMEKNEIDEIKEEVIKSGKHIGRGNFADVYR